MYLHRARGEFVSNSFTYAYRFTHLTMPLPDLGIKDRQGIPTSVHQRERPFTRAEYVIASANCVRRAGILHYSRKGL